MVDKLGDYCTDQNGYLLATYKFWIKNKNKKTHKTNGSFLKNDQKIIGNLILFYQFFLCSRNCSTDTQKTTGPLELCQS